MTSSFSQIDIQGHRGCRGLMPENTLEAFQRAIALGVHTLEMDVVVSKDNIVVVSHEPFINSSYCLDPDGNEIPRKTEKNLNMYQMTFDRIITFDCGSKAYQKFPEQQHFKTYKPSLDAVFKLAKRNNPTIKFNIEIKTRPDWDGVYTPQPKEFVELVLKVVQNNNAFAETNLQSFDLRTLEEIHRQSPNMKVALLVDENEKTREKLSKLSFKPTIISPYFRLLNEKIIEDLQKSDFLVIPWTVNNIKDLERMIALKVDGIITDYPNRLITVLKDN